MATRCQRSERGVVTERGAQLVWTLIGAEQGDVLLAERQVDLGEVVERGKLARIGEALACNSCKGLKTRERSFR